MNYQMMGRFVALFIVVLLIGCSGGAASSVDEFDEMLVLPQVTAVTPPTKLNVIATTSIIGDVVAQVGGDTIELTVLMPAGQDPHSYEPAARDLTAVADADVIFVNGWDLEENLIDNLDSIAGDIPIVAVSAGIEPLVSNADDGDNDHDHTVDPHVWLSVKNVMVWTDNIAQILAGLDPESTAVYQSNAQTYQTQLNALDDQIRQQINAIPPEKRVLVTNHDALGHFVNAYSLQLLGTVIPAMSTLSEPSASDLAQLVNLMADEKTCAIFTETTVSSQLAETVAAELDTCETVSVLSLYTGSLGPVGSSADSYIGMMTVNATTISEGLK